jgi:S1-C subfamily serine protease
VRILFAVVAALTFAALAFAAGTAGAVDLPELAERTKPSVVHLSLYDGAGHPAGSGSGFFVSNDGKIVTNWHVVDKVARMTATLSDGRVVEIAGLLAKDSANDVAVVAAAPIPGGYPPLELGETRTLAPGQEVVVIGSPKGLAGTLSTGIVSALRDGGALDATSWQVQITAPISPGSSGSPVLSRDGRVVGVAVGHLDGENLNFCIPIEFARALLGGLGDHPKVVALGEAPSNSELFRNLGISAAVFAAVGVVYGVWRRQGRQGGGARRSSALRRN